MCNRCCCFFACAAVPKNKTKLADTFVEFYFTLQSMKNVTMRWHVIWTASQSLHWLCFRRGVGGTWSARPPAAVCSRSSRWLTDRQTLRLQGWGTQRSLVYSICIVFFSLLTMKLDAAASDRLENICTRVCRSWDQEQSLKLQFSHPFAQWREGKKSPRFIDRRAPWSALTARENTENRTKRNFLLRVWRVIGIIKHKW